MYVKMKSGKNIAEERKRGGCRRELREEGGHGLGGPLPAGINKNHAQGFPNMRSQNRRVGNVPTPE